LEEIIEIQNEEENQKEVEDLYKAYKE